MKTKFKASLPILGIIGGIIVIAGIGVYSSVSWQSTLYQSQAKVAQMSKSPTMKESEMRQMVHQLVTGMTIQANHSDANGFGVLFYHNTKNPACRQTLQAMNNLAHDTTVEKVSFHVANITRISRHAATFELTQVVRYNNHLPSQSTQSKYAIDFKLSNHPMDNGKIKSLSQLTPIETHMFYS